MVSKKISQRSLPLRDLNTEKENFSNHELIHLSKELKKENMFLKSKLKELEKEINQSREVILNCQQEHEKRVAEKFQAEKEAFNSRFSHIFLFLDNFAKTFEQRIFESKRALPAETEAAIKEVEKDEHNDHEVRDQRADLSFVDWEHPYVQYMTQSAFPVPGYSFEKVRNTMNQDMLMAFFKGVMEKVEKSKGYTVTLIPPA